MTVAACIARMGTDNRAFMSYSQFYAQVGGVGGWVGLGGGGGQANMELHLSRDLHHHVITSKGNMIYTKVIT